MEHQNVITAPEYEHRDYELGARVWIRQNLAALLGEYVARTGCDEAAAEVQFAHLRGMQDPTRGRGEFALFCLDEYDRVETEALADLREQRQADRDARWLEVASRRW